MKKGILIAVPSVLLFAILFIYITVPIILPTAFYTRHILIYIFFAYFVGIGAYLAFRFVSKQESDKPNQPWILRGLVVVSTALVLFGGSELQLYLIDSYEVPPLLGCTYYDEYDNLIYSSQYPGTCPDIELEYTYDQDDEYHYQTLHVEITETTTGSVNWLHFDNTMITVIDIDYELVPITISLSSISSRLPQAIRTEVTELSVQTHDGTDYEATEVTKDIQIIENSYVGSYNQDVEKTILEPYHSSSTIMEYHYEEQFNGELTYEELTLPVQEDMDLTRQTVYDTYLTVDPEHGYEWSDDVLTGFNYNIEIYETNDEKEPDLFATGFRMNTFQELTFFMNEFNQSQMRYTTTYHGSRWTGRAESYSALATYPDSNVIGYHYSVHFYDDQDSGLKDFYTDVSASEPKEVSVLQFRQNETLYLIDGDFSVEFKTTDYGEQHIYYSTMRDATGRYTIHSKYGIQSYDDLTTSRFIPTFMVNDGKEMLLDVSTYKPIYQRMYFNPLIYGVSTGITVFF